MARVCAAELCARGTPLNSRSTLLRTQVPAGFLVKLTGSTHANRCPARRSRFQFTDKECRRKYRETLQASGNADAGKGGEDDASLNLGDGSEDGGAFNFSLLQERIAEVKRKSDISQDTLQQNWKQGRCTQRIVVNIGDWVRRTCFRGDTLAVGTFSGAVLVYDIPSSVALAQFDGDGQQRPSPTRMEISALAISLDGDLVASGSIDGILKVHSLSQKRCVYETKLPSAPVQAVCFDPSGRFLAAVSETQMLQVEVGCWADPTWLELCDEDSVSTVCCMAAARAPDGDVWYAHGLANGLVQVRRAEGGELAGAQTDPLLSFRPHPCGVRSLDAQFEAGKLVLYTGCENGEVAAWEVQATRSRFRWSLLGHQGAVAALQSDGTKLVSGALDGTVRIWDVNEVSGHPLYAISGHTAYMGSVQFEAGRLICDGTNNTVLMHDFLNLDD
eukprot:CAMPEP_0114295224 /NCGR_PEP_ID=MMETSP0059-20121206/10563_1 /TAXON_ID=36894 /ORGANISM="Pyramimonas parkeae, Strain CCMP726" /LENGTH=444 /DNA_ID=CAMNT_0001417089 /DNA_START=64 /DNA_END=1398 /DNA_ORIENTATION=-